MVSQTALKDLIDDPDLRAALLHDSGNAQSQRRALRGAGELALPSDLHGDINVQIDRGEVTFSRVGGKFNIEADRTNIDLQAARIDGDSKFDIDRGELKLKIPSSQGLTIATDISRRGAFDTDFTVNTQTVRDKNFEGTVNGGGPRISFRTDRGRIHLIRE